MAVCIFEKFGLLVYTVKDRTGCLPWSMDSILWSYKEGSWVTLASEKLHL